MGGLDSEIGEDTTDILLESACFDPLRVSLGGGRLGLVTESRKRFERGTDPSLPGRAADRAAREGLENAQNLSLTAIWAVYAVAGLIIGIWRKWRWVRIGCLALLVVPIGKVFVYDVFNLETSYRIGAFVGLGLLLLVSAYLYQRYSKIIKGVFTSK